MIVEIVEIVEKKAHQACKRDRSMHFDKFNVPSVGNAFLGMDILQHFPLFMPLSPRLDIVNLFNSIINRQLIHNSLSTSRSHR